MKKPLNYVIQLMQVFESFKQIQKTFTAQSSKQQYKKLSSLAAPEVFSVYASQDIFGLIIILSFCISAAGLMLFLKQLD